MSLSSRALGTPIHNFYIRICRINRLFRDLMRLHLQGPFRRPWCTEFSLEERTLKGDRPGEFEEIVLLATYGYAALDRLERKG